jgi:hypothetical protein
MGFAALYPSYGSFRQAFRLTENVSALPQLIPYGMIALTKIQSRKSMRRADKGGLP